MFGSQIEKDTDSIEMEFDSVEQNDDSKQSEGKSRIVKEKTMEEIMFPNFESIEEENVNYDIPRPEMNTVQLLQLSQGTKRKTEPEDKDYVVNLSLLDKIKNYSVQQAKKTKQDPEEIVKKLEQKEHACDLCDFKTKSYPKMRNHIKSEHTFYCCEQNFFTVDNLEIHIKEQHENVQLTCVQCSENFLEKQLWTDHMKAAHEKENVSLNYRCIDCDMNFCFTTDLTRHLMDKHRNKRFGQKFKCTECFDEFSEPNLLGAHMKTVHEKKNIFVKYNCPDCNLIFSNKGDFNKHRKEKHINMENIFVKYKCSNCDASFFN